MKKMKNGKWKMENGKENKNNKKMKKVRKVNFKAKFEKF